MADSTHRVEVVPVVLEPHPNADSLSIVRVWGYTVVVRTEEWKDKGVGAYIPPDSVVPDTPQFSFLGGHRRVRTRRFRGVMSQGLLVPAPEGAKIGDDVAGVLGVTHYEPPVAEVAEHDDSSFYESGPFDLPKYDIESGYRYPDCFVDGEEVIVTEKIHGTNACFVWHDDRLWAKGRTRWHRPPNSGQATPSLLWKAVQQNPWIEEWCRSNPDTILYGEVFGWVQELHYGAKKGEYFFRVFDVMSKDGRFLDAARLFLPSGDVYESLGPARLVPVIANETGGPHTYSLDSVKALAYGPSLVPGAEHEREGVVVVPTTERWDQCCGRVKLKFVS